MEAAMERLHFVCPSTGRTLDVGVVTEIETLLRIKSRTLRAPCSVCGGVHEWKVSEAALPKAA
jgi:hypothetical protein